MNDNADQHWSFSRMVWDGFAQWLPATTLMCFLQSALSVLITDSIRAWPSSGNPWLKVVGAALVFSFFNTYLIHCSVRYGAWRVWLLGGATLAGIVAGVWLLWFNWHKARSPGSFSPSPAIAVAATLLLIGWAVVLKFRHWTFVPLRERRRRAGQCLRCGYSLAGLSPGLTCPECGGSPDDA